jgi:hypothetical protein
MKNSDGWKITETIMERRKMQITFETEPRPLIECITSPFSESTAYVDVKDVTDKEQHKNNLSNSIKVYL